MAVSKDGLQYRFVIPGTSPTHLSRDAHHRTATVGYCLSTLPKGMRTRLSIFVPVFRFREVILFAHCASLNLTTEPPPN